MRARCARRRHRPSAPPRPGTAHRRRGSWRPATATRSARAGSTRNRTRTAAPVMYAWDIATGLAGAGTSAACGSPASLPQGRRRGSQQRVVLMVDKACGRDAARGAGRGRSPAVAAGRSASWPRCSVSLRRPAGRAHRHHLVRSAGHPRHRGHGAGAQRQKVWPSGRVTSLVDPGLAGLLRPGPRWPLHRVPRRPAGLEAAIDVRGRSAQRLVLAYTG